MAAKQLCFHDDARARMRRGIDLLARAVMDGVLAAGREEGYNAATREFGDLIQMGVVDPAKVTRLALQNAASIAALVLTTDCMIARAPTPPGPASAGGLGGEPEF